MGAAPSTPVSSSISTTSTTLRTSSTLASIPVVTTSSTRSSSTTLATVTTKPTTTSSSTTSKPSTSTNPTTLSTSTRSTTTSSTTTSSASASGTPIRNTGHRGLGFNDAALTQPFSLSNQSSKVSWAYNWASDPYYPNYPTGTYNKILTYVPMLWSAATDLTSIWNKNVANAISTYGSDAVLTFNEPDGCCWECGNSCMNVSAAVSAYKTWVQPYAGKVSLGAPAVTNGVGSGVGLDYLSQFMGNCSGCTVDFIPLHWYGSVLDPNSFTSYVAGAYQKFGKPIWITEFGTTSGTSDQIVSFLKSVLPWLDGQGYVKRYAYFMDRAAGAPYLLNTDGRTLTDIGNTFNSG